MVLGGEYHILCTRLLKQFGPLVWIEKFRRELVREFWIGEVGFVEFFHVVNNFVILYHQPPVPKPLVHI